MRSAQLFTRLVTCIAPFALAGLTGNSASAKLYELQVNSVNDQGQSDFQRVRFDTDSYFLSSFASNPGIGSTSTYSSAEAVTITGHKDGTDYSYTGLMRIIEKFHTEGSVGFFEWFYMAKDDPFIANNPQFFWGPHVTYQTTNLSTDTSLETGIHFLANDTIPPNPPQFGSSFLIHPFSGPPSLNATDRLTGVTITEVPEPAIGTLTLIGAISRAVIRIRG